MAALRRGRMGGRKNRRVVKIGRPRKRMSPNAVAIRNDEHDISDTANSAKCNCRQNNSDGCSTVGTRSMPSGFTVPSMIGQVRGLDVMPMLSCRSMSFVPGAIRRSYHDKPQPPEGTGPSANAMHGSYVDTFAAL